MAPVLVLNSGSSTFKWSALERGGQVVDGATETWTPSVEGAEKAVQRVLQRAGRPEAIGHRIVHGGPELQGPVRIDEKVRAKLQAVEPLAPRHMGPALACVDACARVLPDVVQVAAFDTAFHARMPDGARLYAVPEDWAAALSLRRYGFHGLSVEWSVARTQELLGVLPPRIAVCHLGSGCSVTAVAEGRSIDTTMGYTPLDGLVMATRAGHLDPGAVIALAEHLGGSPRQLESRLESECGLLALAGTADLKEVLARVERDEPRAVRAYAVYLHTLVRAVGGAAAVLGGLDVLVFTGGAGENSVRLRTDLSRSLAFLGAALDSRLNAEAEGDRDLAQPGAPLRILRIHAREDLRVLAAIVAVTKC